MKRRKLIFSDKYHSNDGWLIRIGKYVGMPIANMKIDWCLTPQGVGIYLIFARGQRYPTLQPFDDHKKCSCPFFVSDSVCQ